MKVESTETSSDFSVHDFAPTRLACILVTLVFGWPTYLFCNVTGRPYDRWANHFDPYSPIFSKRERVEVPHGVRPLLRLLVPASCSCQCLHSPFGQPGTYRGSHPVCPQSTKHQPASAGAYQRPGTGGGGRRPVARRPEFWLGLARLRVRHPVCPGQPLAGECLHWLLSACMAAHRSLAHGFMHSHFVSACRHHGVARDPQVLKGYAMIALCRC